MIIKIKIIVFILFLFPCTTIVAQQKKVTGYVKEAADGSAIVNATVLVQNTTNGVVTDPNGEFSINASVGDTLVFSLIGKRDVKIAVGQRNVLEVTLYDDETQLDEITVVAFGTQKKSSVVASIESVKVSDLRVPASNLTSALSGRIPGLISYQTSGEPGADNAQFFVRGITTFGYKTDPLILIDGFESTTGEFARLQPDDIESFSLLKDAAATVLYGSRAANGILIITTKSGREGSTKLSIRIDNHVAMPTKVPKMVGGVEYMRMYNEARMTREPLLGAYYSEQKIQSTAQGLNPMIFPNVDWYNELFKPATVNTKAHVDVSGGGQVATYFVSGGYEHETGLLKVDNRNDYNNNININRFNIRTNVIFKLTSTTTLDARITGRFEKYAGPFRSAVEIFSNIMDSNPVDFPAVYEPDEALQYVDYPLFGSSYVGGGFKWNPYAEMVRGYENRDESNVTAMVTLRQDLGILTKGLMFELKASVNPWTKYTQRRSYVPFYYDLESYNQITGEYKLWCLNPTSGQVNLGDISPGRDATFKYYFEGRATWGRAFGKHNLSGMLVGTVQESLITGGNATSIYESLPERNSGVSGRATYDYDERYFIEGAFGFNGSEKFDGTKRFGLFPSVAGGWLVSNEAFWAPLKRYVNTLKLKGSYGKVGNDAIAERKDRFFYLSDISRPSGGTVTGDGYRWGQTFMNAYSGYSINRYANPNISWEISNKWNSGVELALFNDAVKIQAELFGEDRSNIYMKRENFPSTSGLAAEISGNVGRVKSWGIDGSLDLQYSFTKDFWVTGRSTFTFATNEYVELDEKDYPDKYRKKMGHNVRQEWGLIAERLFVDQHEIKNSPKQDFGEYMAGDIKYKDVNGDGMINDNDMVPLGYPTVPRIQYGFGLSAGYREFDFSFFFQGNAQVSFFINPTASHNNDGIAEGIAPFVMRRNAPEIVARDYWSENNPNVYAFWPRLSTDEITNNVRQSSWWLRDASFLRLKSVELGWTPKLKVKGVQSLRVYLSGENLMEFSRFKLWDPEMGNRGLGYPPNRRFNIGLLLNF